MSTLVVEVCKVKAVYPHPQADALEFITVKGWQVIVQKALRLAVGRKVVYFPPDSVLPPELAERLGITKYLAPLPREIEGTRKPGLRVRAARLRGEPSYGTIDHAVDPTWEVGRDVKDHYGVTKFKPPVRPTDGEALPPLAAFHGYTEIENIRNFPDVLKPGEEVVITEGTSAPKWSIGPRSTGPTSSRVRLSTFVIIEATRRLRWTKPSSFGAWSRLASRRRVMRCASASWPMAGRSWWSGPTVSRSSLAGWRPPFTRN